MKSQIYNLKLIQPYRLIVGLPIFLITPLQLFAWTRDILDNTFLALLIALSIGTSMGYILFRLVYGILTIEMDDTKILAKWHKKMLIPIYGVGEIRFDHVDKIRVHSDPRNLAVKIYYQGKSLFLNSPKHILTSDMQTFITELMAMVHLKGIKTFSHWQEWKEKGNLRIFYIISFLLLAGGFVLVIFVIWNY